MPQLCFQCQGVPPAAVPGRITGETEGRPRFHPEDPGSNPNPNQERRARAFQLAVTFLRFAAIRPAKQRWRLSWLKSGFRGEGLEKNQIAMLPRLGRIDLATSSGTRVTRVKCYPRTGHSRSDSDGPPIRRKWSPGRNPKVLSQCCLPMCYNRTLHALCCHVRRFRLRRKCDSALCGTVCKLALVFFPPKAQETPGSARFV